MKNKETLYCSKIIKEQHNFIIKDVSPSNKLDIGGTIKILQQEQDKNRFSEEDVIELLIRCPYVLPSDVKNWFEQFKK